MISFLVSVVCLAHIKNCPIPNGHHATYQATSKEHCIHSAKSIVEMLGYKITDFKIECREK